jgi:phosphatidylglycerophosphate synthase
MFAEDLLQELRRDGYTPAAIATYARRIGSRVWQRMPRHPELVRSVAGTAFVLFALQFGAALLLSLRIGRQFGVSYLVSSSIVLLASCFWVLIHLGLIQGARDPDGVPPLRYVPIPIGLTMVRLVSIPAIVMLIGIDRWSFVVWLFAASAFTDILDGILARAFRSETRIGVVLDPLTDIAFNASVFVALADAGELPWWVATLILARYGLLVFGTFALYVFHGPVRIQPTGFGKLTGVLSTVLLGLLLLGLAYWPPGLLLRLKEVFDVGLGLMALATIIQVIFIGLDNLKVQRPGPAEAAADAAADPERPAKVVGEIRPPRR